MPARDIVVVGASAGDDDFGAGGEQSGTHGVAEPGSTAGDESELSSE